MTQKHISTEGRVTALHLDDPHVASALGQLMDDIGAAKRVTQHTAPLVAHDRAFVDAAGKAIKTIGSKAEPEIIEYIKNVVRPHLMVDVLDEYVAKCLKDAGALNRPKPYANGNAEQAPIERKAKTPEISRENKRGEPPKASIVPVNTRVDDFELVPLDDIEVGKEPAYLIDGLLPLGPALHVSFGAPKTLKSLLLMHCFLHVAAGMDYCGRKVMQGAVVYVTNEGITGVRRRLVAMRQHLHLKGKHIPSYLVKTMPDMGTNETDAKLLIDKIKQSIPAGTSVRAIAIDTLRRAIPGKDESASKDMGVFVKNCGLISEAFGCLTAVVHHSPRADDTRSSGSNALDAAADSMWSHKRDGDLVTAAVAIMKDGEEGDEWTCGLHLVPVGVAENGTQLNSVSLDIVAMPAKRDAPTTKEKISNKEEGAKTALAALRQAIEECPVTPPASNHIPRKAKVTILENWFIYAMKMGLSEAKDEKSRRRQFNRIKTILTDCKNVRVWDEYAWIG